MVPPWLVSFLTGNFYMTTELQAFGMAYQGALAVRNGRNKDRTMSDFHAFALSTVVGFGGGWMGFIWLGKPTSMITGADIAWPALFIAYALANFTPFDVGRKVAGFLPVTIAYTSLAQLFRALGLMKFIMVAFAELDGKASPYYPTPIIGPVLYGCMLGNMGSFLVKGFDGHLKNGIPWPFQNGLTMGTLFHLYVHDRDGFMGNILRDTVHAFLGNKPFGLDDKTFAMVVVSLFMQIVGILQLPAFLGPGFSPYFALWDALTAPFGTKASLVLDDFGKKEKAVAAPYSNGKSNGIMNGSANGSTNGSTNGTANGTSNGLVKMTPITYEGVADPSGATSISKKRRNRRKKPKSS